MQVPSACPNTHEMCDKAVNDVFLNLFIFLIDIKLKNCVKVLSEDPFEGLLAK